MSLNDPLLVVLSGAVKLDDSRSVRCVRFVQVKHLATECVNEVLVALQMLQSELLTLHPRYWLLKYRRVVLLAIGPDSQVLT